MKKILFILSLFCLCFTFKEVIASDVSSIKLSNGVEIIYEKKDFNVKFVNSSGEVISGVKFSVGDKALFSRCQAEDVAISKNDWVKVRVKTNITVPSENIRMFTTLEVPDGYQKLSCYPVALDASNNNVVIKLNKTTECQDELGTVEVFYSNYPVERVGGIKFGIYDNGNCAGEPYGIYTSNDLINTTVIVPVDSQLSIKPLAYPEKLLNEIKSDGANISRFYCTTFKVKKEEIEQVGVKPILSYGAIFLGAQIGKEGYIYVEEGTLKNETQDNNSNVPTNPSEPTTPPSSEQINKVEVVPGKIANFFIDGKGVSTNLNVFLENDRTYIDIKDLCFHMGCTYERKDNLITLRFDAIGDNNFLVSQTDLSSIKNKINYVVTHEIGSKSYSTYLEIRDQRIFSIKSPTMSIESVDVVSMEKDNNLYVPLRFVAEALGRYVTYEPATKEGEYPNIVISPMGTGEFFEQFDVKISKKQLNNNASITDEVTSNVISLGQNERIYAYSVNKKDNTILANNKTIFYPLLNNTDIPLIKDYIDIGKDNSQFSYQYHDVLKAEKNFIYRINTTELNSSTPFIVISNIEGYPIMRVVNINY